MPFNKFITDARCERDDSISIRDSMNSLHDAFGVRPRLNPIASQFESCNGLLSFFANHSITRDEMRIGRYYIKHNEIGSNSSKLIALTRAQQSQPILADSAIT